jgi:hypothetical protein
MSHAQFDWTPCTHIDEYPVASDCAADAGQTATRLRCGSTRLVASGWSLGALPIQVALFVLVLQVFRQKQMGWLWLAILAHTIVDGVVVFETRWSG